MGRRVDFGSPLLDQRVSINHLVFEVGRMELTKERLIDALPLTRERVRERVTFSSYPMVDNDFQKGVL